MHTKSLKVFCDVVGRRSFSKAADENAISQSGVSQMVHHLEEHLGVKLIDRSKRPFVLTPEGEVYYQGCRKLIDRMDALEDAVRSLRQDTSGKVIVASIYSAGLSHIKGYVQEFIAQYPKAQVSVEYHHPDKIYDLIDNDQADLGLVSYHKSTRSIKAIPWHEERIVLACAPGHPFADRNAIALGDLDGQEMVGFVNQLRIRRALDRAISSHGAEVKLVMEFDNIDTLKRAIEINAGISLLPEPTLAREVREGTIVAVPLNGEGLVRPLGIIHRRGKSLGTTAERFIELLQEKASVQVGEENGNGHMRTRER